VYVLQDQQPRHQAGRQAGHLAFPVIAHPRESAGVSTTLPGFTVETDSLAEGEGPSAFAKNIKGINGFFDLSSGV
jgi:hypothetical protein